MTVRKIIELIDFVKSIIGKENYSTLLQDCIVTIQNNTNNLVLLKELTEKAINDYESLKENEVEEYLDKILVDKVKSFMKDGFDLQLQKLKESNFPDPGSQYSTLNDILTNLQARVNQNIEELDKIKLIVRPFLSKDYSEIQNNENAIFAIIFSNEATYNNLKLLSFELKNWDRGLFLYQQIISDETPKAFEIVEVDQGSVEVVINLFFEVAEKLVDLFTKGFETYGAYLAYKTLIHENLIKTYGQNKKLLTLDVEMEKLLLENVKIAVKDELKKQLKKSKKHESFEKQIEVVTKLVTEHIIKGNNIKLLSAPEEKEEEVLEKESIKETLFLKGKIDYKKLDEQTKQLLLAEFTTNPPEDNYEKE
jgi:hypothetical protein